MLKSRYRHFTDTTDFHAGQSCRAVQIDCLTVFFFRFRSDSPKAITSFTYIIRIAHLKNILIISILIYTSVYTKGRQSQNQEKRNNLTIRRLRVLKMTKKNVRFS